jgi:hypothetical protein
MAIFIFAFFFFFDSQLLEAETRSHGLFRRRPQVEDKNVETETSFKKILEQFSHPDFDLLKKEELQLRNEINDLVNGLVLQNSDVIDQKTTAIKRALEKEKEQVRERLKRIQTKIRIQIAEKMKNLGFQSNGLGTTTFVKGDQKIHIRFAEGKFEIRSLEREDKNESQ